MYYRFIISNAAAHDLHNVSVSYKYIQALFDTSLAYSVIGIFYFYFMMK